MDTPNLPENEIEEITWQDDENRATLFLRSVFVLLSGALILSALTQISPLPLWPHLIKVAVLTIILPVCVIWFFFGQGLRPVEWLTDQKYNAWNYGVSFENYKKHFLWLIPLLLVGIGEAIGLKMILIHFSGALTFSAWFRTTLISLFIGICFAWFIWGYLWFGCTQGFGAIVTTITTILFICATFFLAQPMYLLSLQLSLYFSTCLVLLAFLCSYICWKQKSWIPILYVVILLAPIASLIFVY